MMNLIPGIQGTSSALDAERIRMDVVSKNIANAQVTKAADGKPYQRQNVVFESQLNAAMSGTDAAGAQSVTVARIVPDQRPPILVYRPNHPEADPKTGMVAMPDINIHEEMVDLIASSRSFEANLAAVKTSRQMVMQTLTLGKR
jgi:flagellar basal-body rod protein FlgC